MKKKIKLAYEARAAVMKALGHPTRLFIVDTLAAGERCVCELREMIGDDVSTVSKHLSVLKSAGVIESDKRGSSVFYSLRTPCVMKVFSCMEDVLAS